MESITAIGILYGEKMTVTIKKGENGLELKLSDPELERAAKTRFKYCQESIEPIYGCFLFPKDTLASAKMALENRFFDNEDFKITVNGKLETIPCEEGWIY